MSSQHSNSTVSNQLPAAGAATSPVLTIEANGPARFERQIADDETADIIATHETVRVDFSIEITDPDVFDSLVPKCYQTSTAKADVLDAVFERYDRYEGYSPVEIDDWSLVISGSVLDWQETAHVLEDLSSADSNHGKRTYDCLLSYYRTGLLNDGAVLAQLDLLAEYDFSRSNFGREYLLEELTDS